MLKKTRMKIRQKIALASGKEDFTVYYLLLCISGVAVLTAQGRFLPNNSRCHYFSLRRRKGVRVTTPCCNGVTFITLMAKGP